MLFVLVYVGFGTDVMIWTLVLSEITDAQVSSSWLLQTPVSTDQLFFRYLFSPVGTDQSVFC
jgi:hypothetical protein